jgi:predicted unusual protein kinase regulating ubiquinone biosynthesis (AarF/ABC1/UbiB family)
VTTHEVEGSLIGRAAHITRVLAKYGLKERGAADLPLRERAHNLRSALEELGPTFAKLGQILSTRPDLLPPEVIDELSTLQDQVPPLTEAEVVAVMEEELGVPWEDVFESIDPQPLAAGTIGQVHRATLETGEPVVAKVQRPGARDEIMRDLGLFELFAEKAEHRHAMRRLVDIPAVIDHLSESLKRELDFRREASNIARLREVLAPYPRLDVPGVFEQLSSSRLLVLEFIDGVPVRQAPDVPERRQAARQLIESYYRQVLTDGFFHADPHPGNLLWADGKVYFLDCGMVGEVEPRVRELMLLLVMAFWQEDDAFLSEVVLQLSGHGDYPDLDVPEFQREIGALFEGIRGQSLTEIQLGPVLQGITQVSARHDVRLPASLALTAKALAQMQLAASELDPELDPFSVVGRFLVKRFAARFTDSADPKKLFYEAQKAKVRLNRFVESIERMTGARAGPRFQVDFPAMAGLETTIRRAVRRVALAMLAAATIVATGFAAASAQAPDWLATTMGIGAAALSGLLIADFIWPRK